LAGTDDRLFTFVGGKPPESLSGGEGGRSGEGGRIGSCERSDERLVSPFPSAPEPCRVRLNDAADNDDADNDDAPLKGGEGSGMGALF
jgi:hypothetical protein